MQISSAGAENPSILVTAVNPSQAGGGTIQLYMRMSVEASTVITASAGDTPITLFPQQAAIRIYANPSPAGTTNIAVIVSATASTAGSIWFTPGQGGIA